MPGAARRVLAPPTALGRVARRNLGGFRAVARDPAWCAAGGSIVNVSSLTAVHGLAGRRRTGASRILGSLAPWLGRSARADPVNAVIPASCDDMVADLSPERVKAVRAAEVLPVGVTGSVATPWRPAFGPCASITARPGDRRRHDA